MILISNKQRASLVGIFILVAYSMLTYSITKNIALGFITDIVSGLAVIGIPILMFPIFNINDNKRINYAYLASRLIEGILMIIGGIIILFPSLESYRELIYNDIHIYFFISGALFFYILFYRTQVIPKFISIWGIIATLILLIITIIKLFGLYLPIFQILLLPIILNEIFLAVWLMIKGVNIK
jgi:Domain of unknown function (DUF4386)